MAAVIGVPKENHPGERRVALVPEQVGALGDKGLEVLIESGAGAGAGYPDGEYTRRGGRLAERSQVFEAANILVQIRPAGTDPRAGEEDIKALRPDQVLIGMADPLAAHPNLATVAAAGVTLFALELLPRITRAQSMDVLSSMATIAGYKAAVLAAAEVPRIFPLLMTAAGTLTPARVLIIGVGVAGLQAIATARRLGGVVEAYDVRPEVREQVESVGAKFVDLALEAEAAQGAGGYATAQSEDFYQRQQEALGQVVAGCDVVITTAAVPGKRAPILVTAAAVAQMAPGSVIVDLASERGGNCALTRPGETAVEGGVRILAPLNLPATVPFHASQMYSRNITTFLEYLLEEGRPRIDLEDEIIAETLVAHQGAIVHPRVRPLFDLPEKHTEET